MTTYSKKISACLISLLVLTGCTSHSAWEKGQGVTMAQAYESALHDNNTSTLMQARADLSGVPAQTRGDTAISAEHNTDFMLLPNPTISVYVYPHLANGNIPVPGYSTQFTLYTQIHYALPGEVPMNQQEVHHA